MGFIAAIPELWEKVPGIIQRSIAISIGVLIVLGGLLGLWLVWGSGYIHEKLGIQLTKQDLQEQTEVLQSDQSDLVKQTVDTAIATYDSHLKEYLYEKERDARTNILEPLLLGMEALKRNDEKIMRSQSSATQQIREMPQVFDSKLDKLIEETKRDEERQRERELLEELLRRAKERDGELNIEEPEERPAKKSTIKL